MSKPAKMTQSRSSVTGKRTKSKSKAPLKVVRRTIMTTEGLVKSFRQGKLEVPVLKGVDLEIAEGQFTTIVGQSGSGKSTLLHLLATLDTPDEGQISFNDRRIDNLPAKHRESIRNQQFGLIFQFYHLLPELTTLENILVPRMIQDGMFRYLRNKRQYVARAKELLEVVGLDHRMSHKPNQLSGGEMQRTAIARALISEPVLLLADEPTGNLDEKSGAEVMSTLHKLRERRNLTVVMVTHDVALAKSSDHVIKLVDGVVV